MKKTLVNISLALFMLIAGFVSAEELIFPKTEQEIVEALSIKDGRTVFEDVEYISKKGKVKNFLEIYPSLRSIIDYWREQKGYHGLCT